MSPEGRCEGGEQGCSVKSRERAEGEKEQSHCFKEMEGGQGEADVLCEHRIGWERKERASSNRAT